MTTDTVTSFKQLELDKSLLTALDEVGYETPSPIQAATIPLLLDGRDIIGQAQTGTGKTAAFALPLISNLNLKQKDPQVLVLAPTRELAIQVAEAFQKYAKHMKGFHVLPVYGGQDYRGQIAALKRGVHVVVGTPGRVMDHMRRGTLNLSSLKALVLDEADEMLRMGFIDDVEWVLEKTPNNRQIALFSATMPQQIRHIATKYLNKPEQVTIKMTTTTADTIRQRFWPVTGTNKLDALTRILEAEEFDAMIIFVRTKNSTVELADKLEARGYAAAAINGDIQQNQRERSIQHLKNGKLDILVATDVAARGLDVSRISHVLNYDIPHDTESYVHRIGRTGRAGRNGDAILFVAPREKRLLHAIERATKKDIEMMELPSTQLINDQRIAKFKQRITETLDASELSIYLKMIEEYQQESDAPPLKIAAALALLLQGDTPFLLQNKPQKKSKESWDKNDSPGKNRSQREKPGRDRPSRRERERSPDRASGKNEPPREGMARYRIEVGHDHEVKPGNIMGAIANEADLDSKNIGRIDIHDNFSLVDLPEGMPKEVFNDLKKVWVSGQQLKISLPVKEKRKPASASASHSKGKPKAKNKDTDESKKKRKKKRTNKDKGKSKKQKPSGDKA
ncbi:DEAD-box ATP-dependent RNA helicase DeaD (= CshA) [hydrothermal vent metagenome]|uniref:RNA helicase n=1 Tax=hydrothermal vent metagenome TaxID=652676 RepID=A0A3B0XIC6_9ZZZZ